MIKRDQYGIICQHSKDDPNYMDGGDSLRATGIMALCGSERDTNLLIKFYFSSISGLLVRHPFQNNWNEFYKTSRDQVVCAVASGDLSRACFAYLKRGKVNQDVLDPSVRYYLYKCAGCSEATPRLIKILGKLFLFLSLVWNTKIKPDEEMNQFACICIVMGKFWSRKLYDWHPDVEKNIRDYWSGWRDQAEIGEALIAKLKSVAGR